MKARCSAACNHGACCFCGHRWCQVEHHTTPINRHSGIFPLCEECWVKLTPKERLPYYFNLHRQWCHLDRQSGHEPQFAWEEIENAVLREAGMIIAE